MHAEDIANPATVSRYLDAATNAASARNLVNLTRRYFRSSGHADALYPAGDGDHRLIDAVIDDPALTVTWRESDEHWIARDREGHRVCYTAGELLLLC